MSSIWLCTADWHRTWEAADLTSLCTESLQRCPYETLIRWMAKRGVGCRGIARMIPDWVKERLEGAKITVVLLVV